MVNDLAGGVVAGLLYQGRPEGRIMFMVALQGCCDTTHLIPDLLSSRQFRERRCVVVGGRGMVP